MTPEIMTPKIVALEEHFVTESVLDAWSAHDVAHRELALTASRDGVSGRRLREVGPQRLAAMDDLGVDVQVLSLSTPGVQNLPVAQAVSLQCETNDALAEVVRSRPDRFGGLATLAIQEPARAARELERAVTALGLDGAMVFGRSATRHLDHSDNWAIFEMAEALGVPLHLHPQTPPDAVRHAYYDGLGPATDAALASHGLGWHFDAGVEVVRMMLAGVFDRFPTLQVIVGHWGEVVLFYLDRIDHLAAVAKLPRKPSEYARANLLVTPSGVLSQRYFRWAAEVVGIDRIMFATDYPFEVHPSGSAARFLADADLGEAERAMVASGNWERLRAGIRR